MILFWGAGVFCDVYVLGHQPVYRYAVLQQTDIVDCQDVCLKSKKETQEVPRLKSFKSVINSPMFDLFIILLRKPVEVKTR